MRAGKAQGCICDKCSIPLDSFERKRVITIEIIKGEKFERVSSDTKQKTVNTLDLCIKCYEEYNTKVKNWLKER